MGEKSRKYGQLVGLRRGVLYYFPVGIIYFLPILLPWSHLNRPFGCRSITQLFLPTARRPLRIRLRASLTSHSENICRTARSVFVAQMDSVEEQAGDLPFVTRSSNAP